MALHDIVLKGSTNRSVTVRIIDSTAGTPETGVVFNTSGIDLWYRRELAVVSSVTEVTLAALTTAHADGGFLHINDGEYRFDLPDAAFATGVNHVDFGGTVTGMIVIGGRIRLVDVDIEDSVRAGLTSLPNAAADAAGGLVISDAGGLDVDAMNNNINDIETDTADMQPRVVAIEIDTDELQTDDVPGLIATAQADLDIITGTAGALIDDGTGAGQIALTSGAIDNVTLVATTTTNTDMRGTDSVDTATMRGTDSALLASSDGSGLTEAGGTGDQLTAIDLPNQTMDITGDITGNLSGSVGSVTGAVGSVSGNVDGNVTGSVGSNLELGPSEVLAQVNAALDTVIAELGVAAPAVTPTLRTGLMLLYMALRNKLDVQTSGTDALEIHNDAGTQITSKLLTDAGGDYSEAKMS